MNDLDLARALEIAETGSPLTWLPAAAERLAVEVRSLSGLYEDAVRTLARVIAEREQLEVEVAKWRGTQR